MDKQRFPLYGWIGLALTLGTLGCTAYTRFVPNEGFPYHVARYTTALAWWGYILFVDAWLYRLQGSSLLRGRRRMFWIMLPVSVIVWCWFEFYNFHLRNWHYEGLSPHLWERWLNMLVAFATVIPGVFLTVEWLEAVGLFRRLRAPRLRVSSTLLYLLVLVGVGCVVLPLMFPEERAQYLFALVWVGYVFLLDPINYANGYPSLLGELEQGRLTRLATLFVGGLVCGIWWESWNWWAPTKWVYDAPFTPRIRLFEMPFAGFWGFGPFAWELYAVWHFFRLVFRSSQGGEVKHPVLLEADGPGDGGKLQRDER
ncbi:MAG: hypothetical protein KatS3mg115_2077 [Candidatus Poribacteria bacterium]|nr:MAG: hypothetical protein KatS3mg115_2077 [Candidatus Poribacteria bacterium]